MPSIDPARRRLLATAGLGAVAGAGGGYVVGARPFGDGESDPLPLASDPTAWPFPDYDRGRTRSVPAASAPGGIAAPDSLTERWRVDVRKSGRLGEPVVANGRVHLPVKDTDRNRTTVMARSLGGGRTDWTWRVDNDGFLETRLLALGDAVFCATNLTRGQAVVSLAAATGEERWRHARSGQSALPSLLAATGRLVLADPTGDGQVEALDARTGDPNWTTEEVGEPIASPVFDGERVILAERGGLRALDPGTGDTVWTTPVESETERDGIVWGPILAGDRIVVGTHLGALAAFDAATGDRQWRHELIVDDVVPCGEDEETNSTRRSDTGAASDAGNDGPQWRRDAVSRAGNDEKRCARKLGAGAATPSHVLAIQERFDETADRLHCREAGSGAAVWTVSDSSLPGDVRLTAPVLVEDDSDDRTARVLVGEDGERGPESGGALVVYRRDTGERLGAREFRAGVVGVAVASGRILVRTWDSLVVLG
jgi:outer membrane protein assembly factor BamB